MKKTNETNKTTQTNRANETGKASRADMKARMGALLEKARGNKKAVLLAGAGTVAAVALAVLAGVTLSGKDSVPTEKPNEAPEQTAQAENSTAPGTETPTDATEPTQGENTEESTKPEGENPSKSEDASEAKPADKPSSKPTSTKPAPKPTRPKPTQPKPTKPNEWKPDGVHKVGEVFTDTDGTKGYYNEYGQFIWEGFYDGPGASVEEIEANGDKCYTCGSANCIPSMSTYFCELCGKDIPAHTCHPASHFHAHFG